MDKESKHKNIIEVVTKPKQVQLKIASFFLALCGSCATLSFFPLAEKKMLLLTCRRFMKLRIFNTFVYKYKQNLVSKITNSDKSQAPQFHETAVGRSAFFFIFRLLLFLPPITFFPCVVFSSACHY